ncbi:MAG: hypothetical protein JW828_05780 [Sedimentisphaerales bacterium]|nr:hypothetical protein [Sedimentisphaerales bacterium]
MVIQGKFRWIFVLLGLPVVLWALLQVPQWRRQYAIYCIERNLYCLRPGMKAEEVTAIMGQAESVRLHPARAEFTIMEYPCVIVQFRYGQLIRISFREGYQPKPPLHRHLWNKGKAFVLPVRTRAS